MMEKSDLLLPFSMLYGAIVNARALLYEKGFFKSHDLGAPTISVGNITVGGTGKTPLVAFAAEVLAEKGEKVCILTRGYKRENESERVLVSDGEKILVDAAQAGDEPSELARKLLGKAAVLADADRAEAGKWARENLGTTAFVLDDAFQHRKVKRDLDIVCVDATNPFGNRKLMPAGILREPLRNLRRADAIVITRANLVDKKQIADLKTEISKYTPKAKIFISENKTADLIDLKEFHAKTQSSQRERKLTAHHLSLTVNLPFCALGNPDAFFEQLRREGFDLVSAKTFPDHYFYTQKDIIELEKTAGQMGAQNLLTTAKDAVKLRDLKFNSPCFVVESQMIFDDEEGLRDLINGAGRVIS
jgi:tetraacyldisaccharide 4'-kinase